MREKIFLHIYFQVAFSDDFLGLDVGVQDCKNNHLAWKVLQKSTFAEIGFLMIPGSIFHDFGSPWDQFPWLLLPWRLARKLMNFHRILGSPQILSHLWVEVDVLLFLEQ